MRCCVRFHSLLHLRNQTFLRNCGGTKAKHLQTQLKQIRTCQIPIRISDHEQRISKLPPSRPDSLRTALCTAVIIYAVGRDCGLVP